MESPDSWSRAEWVLLDAYDEWNRRSDRGAVGLSLMRTLADALRKEGLLVERPARVVDARGWVAARIQADRRDRARKFLRALTGEEEATISDEKADAFLAEWDQLRSRGE